MKPGNACWPSTLSTTILRGRGYRRVSGSESRLSAEMRTRKPVYCRDSDITRNSTGNLFAITGNTVLPRLRPNIPHVLRCRKHCALPPSCPLDAPDQLSTRVAAIIRMERCQFMESKCSRGDRNNLCVNQSRRADVVRRVPDKTHPHCAPQLILGEGNRVLKDRRSLLLMIAKTAYREEFPQAGCRHFVPADALQISGCHAQQLSPFANLRQHIRDCRTHARRDSCDIRRNFAAYDRQSAGQLAVKSVIRNPAAVQRCPKNGHVRFAVIRQAFYVGVDTVHL